MSTAATMRVLNVLRHWVSKHAQVSKKINEDLMHVKINPFAQGYFSLLVRGSRGSVF
jgi:Txe/YoeB family toxin of Txe-Axe toxin-antitoxin module